MKRPAVIHPALFAFYPVLFLYAHNVRSTSFSDALSSLILALVLAVVVFGTLSLALRDGQKAGVITSLFLLLFFSYGRLHGVVDGVVVQGIDLGQPRYLLGLSALVFAIGAWLCWRTRRDLRNLTSLLNVVAAALVVMPLVSVGAFRLQAARGGAAAQGTPGSGGVANPDGNAPDIYYIILDGYASASTLEQVYGYDNRAFEGWLAERGFRVAPESVCNYSQTFLSLASSLNMEYLDALAAKAGADSEDRSVPYQMIRNSEVMRFLKAHGYRFVNVRSGWGPTDRNERADLDIACGMGNEFLMVLAQTTMLEPAGLYMREIARERVLCAFTTLGQLQGRIAGPRFVLAHITVPHPPFLFGAEGEPVPGTVLEMSGWVWTRKQDYVDQLVFVNGQVETLIGSILAHSEVPPIIVLQADHGPASSFSDPKGPGWDQPTEEMLRERMRIFNAYYMPYAAGAQLYDSITPVNTFRFILAAYFGADYALLPDRSHYSSYQHPYRLRDVTEAVSYP